MNSPPPAVDPASTRAAADPTVRQPARPEVEPPAPVTGAGSGDHAVPVDWRDRSTDDSDIGWGDDGGGRGADDGRGDEWYLRERPPHHG